LNQSGKHPKPHDCHSLCSRFRLQNVTMTRLSEIPVGTSVSLSVPFFINTFDRLQHYDHS
jgi:hypothetical protein